MSQNNINAAPAPSHNESESAPLVAAPMAAAPMYWQASPNANGYMTPMSAPGTNPMPMQMPGSYAMPMPMPQTVASMGYGSQNHMLVPSGPAAYPYQYNQGPMPMQPHMQQPMVNAYGGYNAGACEAGYGGGFAYGATGLTDPNDPKERQRRQDEGKIMLRVSVTIVGPEKFSHSDYKYKYYSKEVLTITNLPVEVDMNADVRTLKMAIRRAHPKIRSHYEEPSRCGQSPHCYGIIYSSERRMRLYKEGRELNSCCYDYCGLGQPAEPELRDDQLLVGDGESGLNLKDGDTIKIGEKKSNIGCIFFWIIFIILLNGVVSAIRYKLYEDEIKTLLKNQNGYGY